MFYEYLIIFIVIFGTLIASLHDLKTSEIPDWISLIMGSVSLITYFILGLIHSDYILFTQSIIAGSTLLLIGYFLFYLSQWGEGDVLIFGSLGFALPFAFSFFPQNTQILWFPLHLIANTFILGGIYAIFYSIFISIKSKRFKSELIKQIKSKSNIIISIILSYNIIFISTIIYISKVNSIPFLFVIQSSYIFYLIPIIFLSLIFYSKLVDKYAFKKEIHTSQLTEGDVIEEGKLWVGLEKKDIIKLLKEDRLITIKEGIRFAPSFFFAILFCLFFGSTLSLIILIPL
jgi:Flp pilus assembly protein protease CpaA